MLCCHNNDDSMPPPAWNQAALDQTLHVGTSDKTTRRRLSLLITLQHCKTSGRNLARADLRIGMLCDMSVVMKHFAFYELEAFGTLSDGEATPILCHDGFRFLYGALFSRTVSRLVSFPPQ